MEDGGTEVGKIVYKVELDSDALNHDIDYVSQQLEKLPDAKNINISSGDIVGQWAQAQAEIDRVSQSILYLTQGLGDASTKASDVSMAIAQIMSEFRNGGGDIDAVVQRISSLGEAAGIDSNGQLLNGLYELRDRAEELTADLEQLTKGTAEYDAKNAQLAQTSIELQNALHNLDSTYKPLYTNVQSYIKAAREARQTTREFNDASSSATQVIPNLARQLSTLTASWSLLKRSVSTVTEALSDYRSTQDEIAAKNGEETLTPLAKSWEELDAAISNVKVTLATAFEPFAEVVGNVAEWVSQHRELVAALTGGVSAFLGVASAAGVVTTALKLLGVQTALTKAQMLGIVGVVGLIAGAIAGFAAYNNVANSTIDEQTIALKDADKKAREYADAALKADKANRSATKSTKDFSQQLQKLRRDFLESLKQIEVNHNQSIEGILTDLADLRADYEDTITERNAKFAVTMAKEERSHQELVSELTAQLDFLKRYNNDYNREKLERTQFALEKEQALYEAETQKRQAEIDAQNAADKRKYDQRREALEKELADELKFMEQHREDLNEVRNIILLDEIDMLKRRYEEQKISYAQQESAAVTAANAVTKTWEDYYQEYMNRMKEINQETNQAIATQTNHYVTSTLEEWKNAFGAFTRETRLGVDIQKFFNTITGQENLNVITEAEYRIRTMGGNPDQPSTWTDEMKRIMENARAEYNRSKGGVGRALGGYTGFGPKYEVAGVVHRGEYVVPKEDVDQESGLPNAMGGNQYITINLEGTFATSSQERRKVAQQIADALAQLNKAGRTTTWA